MSENVVPQIEQLLQGVVTSKAENAVEILESIIKKSEAALHTIKAQRSGLINDPYSRGGVDGETLTEHL